MKDFVGREVNVGDYIFYSTTGRNAELRICRVTRFTSKSMFVVPVKINRHGLLSKENEVVVRNVFVKLEGYSE